jgi:hypothetical protein
VKWKRSFAVASTNLAPFADSVAGGLRVWGARRAYQGVVVRAPNIGPFQILLCHFFNWHRAGRRRQPQNGYERARCRGCAHNLRREPGGNWKLASKLETAKFEMANPGTAGPGTANPGMAKPAMAKPGMAKPGMAKAKAGVDRARSRKSREAPRDS